MTDRVLTEEKLKELHDLAIPLSGKMKWLSRPLLDVIASHRLQAARIQELEKQVEECRYGY